VPGLPPGAGLLIHHDRGMRPMEDLTGAAVGWLLLSAERAIRQILWGLRPCGAGPPCWRRNCSSMREQNVFMPEWGPRPRV
jgi:hypothetical protein